MTTTMTIMRRLGARATALALAIYGCGCVVRVRVVDVAIEHPTSVPCMPTWITPQTVPPSWAPSPSLSTVKPIFCTDTRGCWSTTFAIREVPADASAPGIVGVSGDGSVGVTTPKNP